MHWQVSADLRGGNKDPGITNISERVGKKLVILADRFSVLSRQISRSAGSLTQLIYNPQSNR